MFFFWFWLSIVCHTEDKICQLLLGRYDASPKLMQLSADDLKSLGTSKMQARLQTLPSSQMHYLIGFLHDHGWLHIGNSWGELLADDHVEATPPVLSM